MKTEAEATALVEKLNAQIQQKQAQIRHLLERGKAAKRKTDNRKRYLLGGVMLEAIEKDPALADRVKSALDKHLAADQERALFGFPPRPKSPNKASGAPNRSATSGAGVP